jgi:hypothetical protein
VGPYNYRFHEVNIALSTPMRSLVILLEATFVNSPTKGSKHSGWFALFTIVFFSSSDFVRGKVSVSVFFFDKKK